MSRILITGGAGFIGSALAAHLAASGKDHIVVADNLRLGAATNAVRIASRWFPSEDAALNV